MPRIKAEQLLEGMVGLVNPADFSFELGLPSPQCEGAKLQEIVGSDIRIGRFAAALRPNSIVFVQTSLLIPTPPSPMVAVLNARRPC